MLQLLSGIRVIKVYQAEENETRVAIAKSQKYFDVFFATTVVRSRVQLMIESIGGLSLMTIITLGGYRVSHGLMSWEKMVAFVSAASVFSRPFTICTERVRKTTPIALPRLASRNCSRRRPKFATVPMRGFHCCMLQR